jgi:hypothetical protein
MALEQKNVAEKEDCKQTIEEKKNWYLYDVK